MVTPSVTSHSTSTPYETVRQAVNRLEETGYVRDNDSLSVVYDDLELGVAYRETERAQS